MPKALNEGFFGRPTGADRSIVGAAVEVDGNGEDVLLGEANAGLAGNADAIGKPSRAAAEVATGRVEVEVDAV